MNASQILQAWPPESRETTELVIEAHGEPDEATASQLTWHNRRPWKRIVATRTCNPHEFPKPRIDCIESFIDYQVPVDKYTRSRRAAMTSRPTFSLST